MIMNLRNSSLKFRFDSSMADAGTLKRIQDALKNPDMSRLEKYPGDTDYAHGLSNDYMLPLSDGYVLCTTGGAPYDEANIIYEFGGVYIGRNNDGIEIPDEDVLLSWSDDDLSVLSGNDDNMVMRLCRKMGRGMDAACAAVWMQHVPHWKEALKNQQDGVEIEDAKLPRRMKTLVPERGQCVFDDIPVPSSEMAGNMNSMEL